MSQFKPLVKPTRLYIKKCPKTGLKYFGMSTRIDIENYTGSGTIWLKHLKEHKVTPIHVWNSDWYYDTSIEEFALNFSRENNIDKSELWANRIYENGINKGWTLVNLAGRNLYGLNGKTANIIDNLNRGRETLKIKMLDPTYKANYSKKMSNKLKSYYKINDGSFTGKTHTEEAKKLVGAASSVHQKGSGNSQYGTMWITNGTENMKIKKESSIPDGWYKGRITKFN